MGFEWDERKNQDNIGRHGISFQTASEIFQGPVLSRLDNPKDYGEPPLDLSGKSSRRSFDTIRNDNIRFISARLASQKERKLFAHAKREKREGSQENEG